MCVQENDSDGGGEKEGERQSERIVSEHVCQCGKNYNNYVHDLHCNCLFLYVCMTKIIFIVLVSSF